MSSPQDELADLLSRCARQDRAALRRLFDLEAGRMKGIAMRVLHRDELAEDAVQEAFLQVWHNAARYTPELGSPRSWMYTIARFRAIDILRNRSHEEAVEPDNLDHLREGAVREAADGLDPEGRLRVCLDTLERTQRHVLLLIYVTGLTQAEIAGKLGRPLGTVKTWVRRSLLALRECLQ
ncbi:RNA polymerase sigma-70 factor, ECF subfamily [Tranquillimonas rosea]|uniref:RNA polymerase sigma-70 factor, ECF subfamily n=1 Tax=Tranquillimonas rosea TaxID=641238 RepID=A0A1H9WYC1_9RHOB|nr:sigma-70 family RNA polymerase sigma factor [Tranquillimonas rosea]SES38781.1 RNA polymerase sigma-70 factor, ECF subfamily [Tranquillimonas rosea]